MPTDDRDPKQESRPAQARITGAAAASLHTLITFAVSLLAEEDVDDLLWSMVRNIDSLLGFEDCVIFLREGDELVQAAAHGIKNPEGRSIKSPISIPVGRGIVGAVGKTGRTERVGDTASDARYISDVFTGRSELAVALMYEGKVLGVLDSEASTPDRYSDADQEMFEQIAVLAAPRIASMIAQREQRKVEEALRRSEAGLADAQAVAHVGSWEWDIVANEESWSDETYRIFGVRPEDFTPSYENYLSTIHPDDREMVVAAVEAAMRENERVDVEYRIVWPDGTECIVNSRGSVFRDDRGTPVRMVGTVHDITEKRKVEDALRQAQKMEAVGRLTGGIAHDFNNLLTVIQGNLSLIASDVVLEDAGLQAGLADAQDAARRGAALVKKLLAFSRESALSIGPLDMSELVAELTGTLRPLLPESIETSFFRDAAISTVRADAGAVQQILMNLATNARDAMPKGGVLRIETRRAWLDESHRVTHGWGAVGEYICVSVSDTGTGMDEETTSRIFEPFFTTKPPGEGTGLGMAMIFGLMKQHKGFVDVRSAIGEGTTVRLYFPVSVEGAPAPIPEREPELTGGTETILLIEDEAPIRRAAKRVLERYGYTVLLAEDGAEGLRLFHAHRPEIDLVLCDMVMPRMNGSEVYKVIRQEPGATKFMFMSGYSKRDVRESVALDPTIPFLPKPWTITDLLVRVREVLDQNTAD